jgi:hypothetical protein
MMSRMGTSLLLFQGGLGRIAVRQRQLVVRIRETDLVDIVIRALLDGQLSFIIRELS